MSTPKQNPMMVKAWRATLAELAQHNRPVEVVPVTDGGVELPRIRARLLSADAGDGSLVVEKPGSLKQAEVLTKGVAVEVYVITASTRMKARSKVIDVGWFKLNAKTRVTAVRLQPVKGIASAQRRASFRVSTSALGMTAELRCPEWPEDRDPFTMRVLDLSDRGVGLSAAMEFEAGQQMEGKIYAVHVPLPGEDESLDLEARLVRVIDKQAEANGVTLGFQFEFADLNEQRRVERIIQQFSAHQQRKQLQRMRGAG
ncbi:MAG: PilZ domain-containing protein [Planctomycetota bacterium]